MLINNITELREYIPASVTLNFADIRPKIRQVEREIIHRIFSQAIYDRLTTEETPTAEDTALKQLLAEAVALLALLEYIPIGQLQFDSAGIRIASNESMKTAFEWQIDELKTTCNRQGWSAIESALAYCESLPDGDLKTLWEETDTYTASQSNLITTLRQFETFAHLQGSRVMFNKLIPTLADQQDEVVIPAIGQELFTAILERETESDEPKKNALTKAHKLASKALAYLTLGVGFQDSMLILSDNGPLVIEAMQSRLAKAVKTAPESLISAIATTYRSRGAAALKELIDYCQSVSDVLTEYQSSPNFISIADQTDHIPRNDPNWGIAFF
jgi:vacuolar-type H+-ATPase subunit E/Vma4